MHKKDISCIPIQIGEIINQHYIIQSKISQGGMGIIYKGWDLHLKRTVAIKMLLLNDNYKINMQRFQREIKISGRLNHPNIVKIYATGTYNLHPYLIMEYIQGESISDYVEKDSENWLLISRLIQQIAQGLYYMHQYKLLHRDITPDNILVTPQGIPILIDFGIAIDQKINDNVTKTDEAIGTLPYMSLEQLNGKQGKINERSDIYSLGLVFYELITKYMPYGGDFLTNYQNKMLGNIPTPCQINNNIPKEIENIILKAIQPNKENRYSNANQMAQDLQHYIDQQCNTVTMPLTIPPSLSNRNKKYRSSNDHQIVQDLQNHIEKQCDVATEPMIIPSSLSRMHVRNK
ncbi:MAG TPA: serine/threonine-protein kinase, partial [Planctomycetota bacterium]|nr:serine/threonine-protein kinase [Planctomycetota bacterium]